MSDQNKKIYFIAPDIFCGGGLQRVTINIAKKLSERNYDVIIISLSKSRQNPIFDCNPIKVISIDDKVYKLKRNLLKYSSYISKIIPENDNVSVVCSDVGISVPAYLALKKRKNVKLIAWEHMNFYHGKRFSVAWLGKRIATKHFDKIVVLTKKDYDLYTNNLRCKNLIQIYNPIENISSLSGYNLNSKKIISVGSLTFVKGFDMLMDVARIVFDKYPDWSWDIYGEGNERENLIAKINNLGLKNNVFLKGFSSKILEIYSDYSFYVMTSREEGFGLVITEAQKNFLPVISFDCLCGPSDLIKNDVNGFLIKNFDINEMAKKIITLISDKDLRLTMSKNSMCNFEELEIDYVIKKWIEIL